jgi:hypothetical protein
MSETSVKVSADERQRCFDEFNERRTVRTREICQREMRGSEDLKLSDCEWEGGLGLDW